VIRGRTGAADPRPLLESVQNNRRISCARPGEFLDIPIRPRFDTTIPDIAQRYFVLHKFIGDIVWMCGGAEPISDDEEDDDDEMVVTKLNISSLFRKLRSPAMDLVPRERQTMFGSCMVPVPKDLVWV